MSAYDPLLALCKEHSLSGAVISKVLSAYADCLEGEQPHAAGEAAAAEEIGLNIQEILEEQA